MKELIGRLVYDLLVLGMRSGTAYLEHEFDSELLAGRNKTGVTVIRATRRLYKSDRGRCRPLKNKNGRNITNADIVVTIGRPNYAERKVIASCRRRNISLPGIEWKSPPAKVEELRRAVAKSLHMEIAKTKKSRSKKSRSKNSRPKKPQPKKSRSGKK